MFNRSRRSVVIVVVGISDRPFACLVMVTVTVGCTRMSSVLYSLPLGWVLPYLAMVGRFHMEDLQ